MAEWPTLIHWLRRRATEWPSTPAYRFAGLSADGPTLTFGEIHERAEDAARRLRARGIRRGDRVILMLPTGEDFVVFLFGILIARAVPVPVYPPTQGRRLGAYLGTIRHIIGLVEPALILVPEGFESVESVVQAFEWRAGCLATPSSLWADAPASSGPDTLPEQHDLALIQFSSGSTGIPKGVCLTHGNIISNLRDIGEVLELGPDSTPVSWLPLYHDMGLIGFAMGGIVYGSQVVLVPPTDFLRYPPFWIQTISRYRGTITAAPQFAYSLVLRAARDQDLAGCDLSSLRTMLNGAEPPMLSPMQAFAEKLAPYGLRRDFLVTCYGMSENSLAVSFARHTGGPRGLTVSRHELCHGRVKSIPRNSGQDGVSLMPSGFAVPNTRVRIADDDGEDVGPGKVGEILVSGASACRTIVGTSDQKRDAFGDEWIRTGDLGFVHDGEIFIAGRRKEVIIVAGRKYYPPDIESALADIPGLRAGRVVAISFPSATLGTEELMIVAEPRSDDGEVLAQVEQAVRLRLVSRVGVAPREVIFVNRGEIPVTSSGKLQRRLLHEACARGLIRRLGPVSPFKAATAPPSGSGAQSSASAAGARVRATTEECPLGESKRQG